MKSNSSYDYRIMKIKDTIDDIREDLVELKTDREVIKANYSIKNIKHNDGLDNLNNDSLKDEKQSKYKNEINNDKISRNYKQNSVYYQNFKSKHSQEQKNFEKKLNNKSYVTPQQNEKDFTSNSNISCFEKGEDLKLNFNYNTKNKSIDHNIDDRTFDKKNISSSIPRQRNHFVKKENESTNLVCYNLIKGKNDI